MRRAIVSLAIAALLAGCHTMRFELEQTADTREVHDRHSYFFWGLVPTKVIDVREKCASGVVALRENTSFLDGLLGLPSFGIWSFRSTTYYCRPAAG
jgi:hypothetical protein